MFEQVKPEQALALTQVHPGAAGTVPGPPGAGGCNGVLSPVWGTLLGFLRAWVDLNPN